MSINCIANTEDQCIDVVDPSEFILSTWTDTAAAAAEIHHYNTSAVVPLKCHANENSFFGAEGLCSSDWQDFYGIHPTGNTAQMMMQLAKAARVTSLVLPAKTPNLAKSPVQLENTFQGWKRLEEKENLVSMWVEMRDPPIPKSSSSSSGNGHYQQAPQFRPILPKRPEDDVHAHDLLDHHQPHSESDCDDEDAYSSSISLWSDGSSPISYRTVAKKRKAKSHIKTEKKKKPKANFQIFHKYQQPQATDDSASPPTDDSTDPTLIAKPPRFEGDLYTPKWQRGEGEDREALCPFCAPAFWLRTKQSAYWYHMNYHHGINAKTGRPYEAPLDYQLEKVGAIAKMSGRCGRCDEWVAICNKNLEGSGVEWSEATEAEMIVDLAEINFISWYRHAQKCHAKANGL